MSASLKQGKERKQNGRKKRTSDANHSQGPPRSATKPSTITATIAATTTTTTTGGLQTNGHGETVSAPQPISDDDLLKQQLAQRIISIVHAGEAEAKLLDVISMFVEDTTVAEVEMLREEVQNLKRMLHNATGMLQNMAKERGESGEDDWEQQLQKELHRQKKRLQEEHKRDMDSLRLYFEKQYSQGQTGYVSEIYALKLECQDLEQLRGDTVKLRELCDHRSELLQRLQDDHDEVVLEKRQHEQYAGQLQATLMKMEKEKLASEERTKKILSAVRDGLHKLSDMKTTEAPTDGGVRDPGLSTFYNHVEEIITTDDWSDDDVYVKGVMEEIQVSVQKLSRPSRTLDRPTATESEYVSVPSQTDFSPTTPSSEVDAVKLSFEARILALHDTANMDRQQYEQSLNDFQQQVDRLTGKSQADKRFIDELSSDRESEREEMLKLTQNVEDAWREIDKQKEKNASLQTHVDELEAQSRVFCSQNAALVSSQGRLQEDLLGKDETLRQREELVIDLESQIADRNRKESDHQKQLEQLKMELSGFLHSPPPSPEPSLDESSLMDFEDLRRQIMDLKDELEAKNRKQEKERDERIYSLHDDLEQVRRAEKRALRNCDSLQQQIEQQDMEIAVLRQQVDDAKFSFSDESVVDQLNTRIMFLQKEMEGCHRVIEQLDTQLHTSTTELQLVRKILEDKDAQLEQAGAMINEDVIKLQMKDFDTRNQVLLQQVAETAALWDEQQKAWEEDVSRKAEELIELQQQLSRTRDLVMDFFRTKTDFLDTKKRLEQTEASAQEKTVQIQSLKNLVDIMKSESSQKDIAVKAVQKQLNDNSGSLAKQLEELERSNLSMQEEIDVYRNAPDRSAEIFEPLLRDKDAEISHLRDLLEASFDESLTQVLQSDSSVQTDGSLDRDRIIPAIVGSGFDWSNAEMQAEPTGTSQIQDQKNGSPSGDYESAWRLNGFGAHIESRDSGNNSKTPEPENNLTAQWNTAVADVSSTGESGQESISGSTRRVNVEIQADLVNLQNLLTEITSHNTSIRELQHSLVQKDIQIETMALELASLSDRHGKTQTKHRTTIRYLHQSGQSSSDEGSTNSLPRSNPNGESKQLIEKYEERIREIEQLHTEEIQLLLQESLSVLQSQTAPVEPLVDNSSREVSPASAEASWMEESTLADASFSATLQKALRDLRSGSNAILKASNQLHSSPATGTSPKPDTNGHSTWTNERELLLGKIDFFRDTIGQLVLSRDSMEMALRHLEQQNEDLKADLEMLKKEDQMADQGKDLLLSLLKKTEAELAELHSRYRQRDLRLEIEQAGREREEHEREKLQKELRETEVQLVRVRGELRQKDAQWEREKILTMWKKESEESEQNRASWRGKYLRAESYRKNLIHQKRYLITLMDDVIINTTDSYIKQLALDGIRPTTTRRPPGVPVGERKKATFKSVAVVVCAVNRLKLTSLQWQQVKKEN